MTQQLDTYVGDAVLTRVPHIVGVLAADGEESLEHIFVEVAAGLVSSMVGHHGNDEVVGSWGNQSGREQWSEVVWVLSDGSEGVLGESTRKLVHVEAVVLETLEVGISESSSAQRVSVTVVDVGVAAGDGGVALVLVVRPGYTLPRVDSTELGLRTTDRPGH